MLPVLEAFIIPYHIMPLLCGPVFVKQTKGNYIAYHQPDGACGQQHVMECWGGVEGDSDGDMLEKFSIHWIQFFWSEMYVPSHSMPQESAC